MGSGAFEPATSRRRVLAAAAIFVGGMALGGAGEGGLAKSSQKAVEYQGHPKAGNACNTCKNFLPPQACKVVEGTVEASGWCDKYTPR